MKKIFTFLCLFVLLLLTGCQMTLTVTFDSNGGTYVAPISVGYGGVIYEPTPPTKEDCEFVCWLYNGEEFNFNQKIVSNITLIAEWDEDAEVITYTVKFVDYNGALLKEETVEEGKSATPPSDPSRIGYTFTGWDKDYTNITSNITIKAKYVREEITTYTVKFIDHDGTVLKQEKVEEGKAATAPSDPSREGYKFIGWDRTFNNITSDLSINAKYEKIEVTTYIVKFVDYNGIVLKQEEVESGKSATAPSDPSRSGYTFTGWDKAYNNVTSNLTINAKYEAISPSTYTISYELNGGVWGYASKNEYVYYFLLDFYQFVGASETLQEFMYGDSSTEYLGSWKQYIGGSVGTTNRLLYENDLNANNEDYFFNCTKYKTKWAHLGKWVQSQNNRFAGSGGYTYGALDFYRYIINNPDAYINIYGEKFYGYPEVNTPTLFSYEKSNQAIALPKPLNELFVGWYINSDFSGEKLESIPAGTSGDLVLYACYDETQTYEVSFNSDGGTSVETKTVSFGDEITLPTITKKDHTFIGWYLNDVKVESPFVFNYPFSVTLTAKWKNNNVTLEDLVYSGTTVKYRNSSTVVQIPTDYVQPETQLRASWVSSYINSFSPSTNEATMKHNLTEVLDLFEKYNLNCMIFHIRTMNNAFYQTDLAPIPSNYGTYETFDQFDYLEWLISECHKRGIEFHAWLNPYRIKAYGYSASSTTADVAATYASYPKNPASKAENILMTYRSDGTKGAILNPCKEEVQDYIVDVCLEVMEKYDVDAIHFDDYFYAQMSSGITVLTEPDQSDYESYITKNPSCGYSKNSANDKKQWRRDNVDNFIKKLSDAMTQFNKDNGRGVQLGIAPTGIYKNGNGSISSGSNTAGQEHYSSYLFCDTKKWVEEEWIDYIMPQSYWAFTHPVAGYADVMDWWNKVVEGYDVNLYSGLGIYMSTESSNTHSWKTQPYEISNQVLYTTKLKNVQGVCIYSHKVLKGYDTDSSTISYKGLQRLRTEYWTEKVATPKTRASQYIK